MPPSDDLNFAFDDPAPAAQLRAVGEERLPEEPPDVVPFPQSFPVVRRATHTVTGAAGRTLPHNLEAEEFLLSCCLLDGADVVSRCLEARIRPESFYDPKHGIIYDCLCSLLRRSLPVEVSTLAEELKLTRQLEQVGGLSMLVQVSRHSPTTAQASYFIERVREQALLREIIRSATGAVEDCYGFSGDIESFAAEAEAKFSSATSKARGDFVSPVKPITGFDYPEADDPNVLLGSDDYLGRGGGMLFVSHAGAGKSSFILDAVMSWALAMPWMGIRSNGALRTLVVQAEDSDRYLGKLRRSFAHVHNLTPEQDAQLGRNCIVARVKGKSGAAFFSELRRLIAKFKPDLVVINPIYLYAEGDISRSEYAQPFLVGLDDLNRDEKFGYILIHHTGKPQAKDAKGKRAELDDWETVYMGFGSSYLANWPRCSALLEPRQGEKSRYWLKLGKGGMNAGVTREIPQGAGSRTEAVTKIPIRHSAEKMMVGERERAVIYWEPDNETAVEEDSSSEEPRKRGKGGRPNAAVKPSDFKEKFAQMLKGRDKRRGFNQVFKIACEAKSVSKGLFNRLIDDCVTDGVLAKDADGDYYVP